MKEEAINSRNELGQILQQRRVMMQLRLGELATAVGVSSSHLSRIERGERFPSASVLRKIAEPLGFEEGELFTLAGYLSPQPPTEAEGKAYIANLDPNVAMLLSQEPVEMQRTVIAILTILKSIAKGSSCNIEFAEYARRKYPELHEDIITMVEDIILVATRRPEKAQPADSETP